jgi:hypothetical protein
MNMCGPQQILPHHYKQQFSIKIQAEILTVCLMGSHIIPAWYGGHNYLNFRQMH